MTERKRTPAFVAILIGLTPVFVGINRCNSGGETVRPGGSAADSPLDRIARPADGSCFSRDSALDIIRPNATWRPAAPPFCTDRPDLTDWLEVDRYMQDPRYFAFDAQGCLAAWQPVPCP